MISRALAKAIAPLLCACALSKVSCAQGPNATNPIEWEVKFDAQIVDVPFDRALPLLSLPRSRQGDEVCLKEITRMIMDGEATLVAMPHLRGLNAKVIEAKSVEEVRYPTDFEPSQEPQTFSLYQKEPLLQARYVGLPPSIETRNAAMTLKLTPTVRNNGDDIELKITLGHTTLTNLEKVCIEKAIDGSETYCTLPQFHTSKISCTTITPANQQTLLTFYILQRPAPHVEFVFIEASAERIN